MKTCDICRTEITEHYRYLWQFKELCQECAGIINRLWLSPDLLIIEIMKRYKPVESEVVG